MAAPVFIAASGPTGNSNAYSVDRPSGVTTGDLIIAFVRAPDSNNGGVAATGWTELTGLRSLGVDWTDDYVFYRFVQSGDPSSDTWGEVSNPAPSAVWQVAYSGVDSIVAAASILRGTTSDTSIVAPAVTAPDPDCLLVGLFGHYDAETTISVSGMTQRIIGLGPNTGIHAAIFDEVLSSAGSTGTRTATLGASRGGRYGALIALVPTAAAAELAGTATASATATGDLTTTPAVKGVSIQLGDGTPAANLTGLSVRWWDAEAPTGAPDYESDVETTDASGWLEIDLSAVTALAIGANGYLHVFKAGATPADDIVAAGRVPVSDIA